MKYIYLVDKKAHKITSEFNPIFPNTPITEHYSALFLKDCVAVDNIVDVAQGDIYDEESDIFTKPKPPVYIDEIFIRRLQI